MLYKGYKKHDFMKDKTTCAFGEDIKNSDIMMDIANDEQKKITQKIREFKGNIKPKKYNMIKEKIRRHK